MSRILIILVSLLSALSVHCQTTNEGTDFWMSFMQHRNVGDNTMVVMITSLTNTSGTVSIPGLGFTSQFNVAANDVTLITMPASAETIGSEIVQQNAIHVVSNAPVSVYIHQYQSFRAEASIVLPVTSLSNEYYVLCYSGVDQQNDGASEFIVVAIEDDTSVTIELSDDSKNNNADDRINILLQQGETYQVRGRDITRDLSGTYVSGDKEFAVFAGASYARIPVSCGNRDNLLEQMYPVNTFGNTYVTAPTRAGDFNVFRILALRNNTVIDIQDLDGTIETVRLNESEFYEYQRSTPTFVSNQDPLDQRGFMLAQYIVGSECTGQTFGGPAMVLLSSVEQIRETVTVYNSSFQQIRENYISIICRNDDIDGIRRNGNPIASAWQTIGLNQELAFAIEPVNTGRHTITSDGCGVIAMAFGLGNAEGYAYFGGASFNEINGNPLPDGECVGNPVLFSSGLPEDRYDVEWTTELGDTIREHQFEYEFPDTGEGEYDLKLATFDNCFLVRDTVEKTIRMTFQTSSFITENDMLLCENDDLNLSADFIPNASYEWTGPNNFEEDRQSIRINNIQLENAGDYVVQGNVFGCLARPTIVNIQVAELPIISLGNDSVICEDLPIPHTLSLAPFTSYDWSDGSMTNAINVFEAGEYSVTVTDSNGCITDDSVTFGARCPTKIYIPNAFSPNGDGINDIFDIAAFDTETYELKIFDRWGNMVFRTRDHEDDWDGNYNNQLAESGVYTWVLAYDGFDEVGNTVSESLHGVVNLLK